MRTAATAALVLVCLSAEVRAECPDGVIPGALTARIDRTGLDALQGIFLGQLPSEIELPGSSHTVFECPGGIFDDTIVNLSGGAVELTFRNTWVSLHEGAIEVDAELDVLTATELDLELCAMPDAVCHADLQSQGITLHARIEPGVTACTPHLPITELDIVVPSYATVVNLSSCGLYDDIAGLIYDWFRELIVELVTETVEDAVQESLPVAIESLTTELVADGVEVEGMHFDVAAQAIEVHWDGITVTAAANITPTSTGACLPAGAALPTDNKASPPAALSNAMVSLAASEPFIQRAVGAAWLAGVLCFDSREEELDLGVALVPFAPDPTLDATVSVPWAPVVRLETDQSITVEAAVLDAKSIIDTSVSEPVEVDARMSAALSGFVGLDYEQQTLTLQFDGAQSEGLYITAAGTEILFTEEGLANLVDDIVLPAFADKIGPLPLTSNLFVYAPIGVRLDEVGVYDGSHLRADLEITAVDTNDQVPPLTIIDTMPPDPSPAEVRFGVASLDDSTPSNFLRHRVRVDGVEEESLVGGSLVELSLDDGDHLVTLAAVDLNGNADTTPVELYIHVDDQSPVVRVVEGPIGLITDNHARIVFDAGDDHTAARDLKLRYTVGQVLTAGPDESIEAGPLSYGEEIDLEDLPEDAIVRVIIFATDEAGNEGSTQVAFGINVSPNFTCGASPGGWAALAALTMLLRRRRRAGTDF